MSVDVEPLKCPACGHAIEIPRHFWIPDEFVGCRVVEFITRFICEGCGVLLEKHGSPSAVEPSRT